MRRAQRRYLRTLGLGLAALATLVWTAVEQFGIPWEEMRALFFTTVIGVLLVIGVAGIAALVWLGLRKLTRGG